MRQLAYDIGDIISYKDEVYIILESNSEDGMYRAYPVDKITKEKLINIAQGKFVEQALPNQQESKVPMIRTISFENEIYMKKLSSIKFINDFYIAYNYTI